MWETLKGKAVEIQQANQKPVNGRHSKEKGNLCLDS